MNNTQVLQGKTAFVAGANRGIGAAIARALGQLGATVIVHYHTNRKEAEEVLKLVQEHSPSSYIISADLTKEESVAQLFKHIGSVDVLINTIGSFVYDSIEKTSFETFADVIETNLYATFLCSQAVLPNMKKRGTGHVINFGSVGCERVLLRPKTTPYYIAKTGVYMLTKILADTYGGTGVRINMVSPGVLPTSIVKPDIGKKPAITFEDIIEAILFLLSPKSSHIIGANIEVSGGWTPELN